MAKTAPQRREDYLWFTTLQTRWMDNDVYGHVNNVQYYSYFDTAVNARLIEQGLLNFRDGATVCLVVETACVYRKALAFPGAIDIGLRVDRLGGSAVTYGLAVFRSGEDDAAAECRYVHVHVDAETHRPLPFDDRWRAAFAPVLVGG